MAGHSKWANIKHRKERADRLKGKTFSRLTKEIIVAVKQGGADPRSNTKLRMVIQKAKAANLPNDNIERNIKKASHADQTDFFEITYELYGHGGVGLIVDVMTDNRQRIASEIRIAINKKGGTIATPGAVSFNFERKGVLTVLKQGVPEEVLFGAVSEAGADDFEVTEELYIITTPAELLYAVKERLDQLHISCESVEQEMLPKFYVACDPEVVQANGALIEWLENLDDVDAVYHNMQSR